MNRVAHRGFTLIELMMVLAVVAILAMIAMPNLQDRMVRDQIVEAVKLADVAKEPIAFAWKLTRSLPADNTAAGLPAPDCERVGGRALRNVAMARRSSMRRCCRLR